MKKNNRNTLNFKVTVFLFAIAIFFHNYLDAQDYHLSFRNDCPHSAKYANVWYFGDYAGLDFNTRPVSVLTNNNSVTQLEGNACISDSNGVYLLSTGGNYRISLWNSSLNTVPNGQNIGGNVSATQSSIIIPQPGDPDIYHIFLVNLPLDLPAYDNGLTHVMVNISSSNPSGEIILRDDTLLDRVSEKITATFHKNGMDVWIIAHLANSDMFYSYKITGEGLQDQPVICQAGTVHSSSTNINQAAGQMKVNPEGNKLALAIYDLGIFELFDFNNESGIISNSITSQPNFPYAYGVEFSANGKYLYASTTNTDYDTTLLSNIFQFDLGNGQQLFNQGVLLSSATGGDYFAALQLATDGKIYISSGNEYVGVIHNPTRLGLECNLNWIDNVSNDGLYLGGRRSKFGLPGFNQSYFLIPNFTYSYNCLTEETHFELVNPTNVDSVSWEFGDGAAGSGFAPSHTFNDPGYYTVHTTEFFNGIGYADSVMININPLPVVEINMGLDTVLLLLGSSVTLDAGAGFQSYQWNDGSAFQTLEVFEEGYYWVVAENENCCLNSDTVFVQRFYMVIPNAFLPVSTGEDKYFQIKDPTNAISDFFIIIYNRLGQEVFESRNKSFQWDGDGCSSGVYYFTLKAILSNGYPYQYNGNVTIIR